VILFISNGSGRAMARIYNDPFRQWNELVVYTLQKNTLVASWEIPTPYPSPKQYVTTKKRTIWLNQEAEATRTMSRYEKDLKS